jgi:hypothetical protein
VRYPFWPSIYRIAGELPERRRDNPTRSGEQEMTRHRWIFASVSLAAALLLWPAPAAHAQSPLAVVPNTINMFRDTRAANSAGIGGGDVLQYGADLQGGSAGASLSGVYPPTGFTDPAAVCTPLAVSANFCSNSTAFNVNRLAVP